MSLRLTILVRPLSLAPAHEDPKPLGYPWRIVVATCVERLPSLGQEKTDIERQYEELKVEGRGCWSIMPG